jgi:protein-tyrosine phosphatase
LDFIILGMAHARGWHRVFGKKDDGRLPWWSWAVFLPLFAYSGLIWHLLRIFSREPRVNRVTDQLVIGRRLLGSEPPGEFANHVDLTAEFQEPSAFRKQASYLCFPILDAAAPSVGELHRAVALLKPGPTFVHCAQGHGRTGLFALAVLLSSGEAGSIEEGLALLRKVRPGLRLNAAQMGCITLFARRLSARDM